MGAVIVKKRRVTQKKSPNVRKLETMIEEDPMVDIFDRKFPQSTVKAWKYITLEK